MSFCRVHAGTEWYTGWRAWRTMIGTSGDPITYRCYQFYAIYVPDSFVFCAGGRYRANARNLAHGGGGVGGAG